MGVEKIIHLYQVLAMSLTMRLLRKGRLMPICLPPKPPPPSPLGQIFQLRPLLSEILIWKLQHRRKKSHNTQVPLIPQLAEGSSFPPNNLQSDSNWNSFESQIQEIDSEIMRYDQELIPLSDQVITGSKISLNKSDGVIFGIDNNENSSHAPLLSEGGTCSTHDGQTNLRTWKRIIRQTHKEDNPMTSITQTGTPQTGNSAGGSRDDSQSELPCKKLQVLKMDDKTNTVMVEAASQPRQPAMSCLFWNCHGLGNLCREKEFGDLIRAKKSLYGVFSRNRGG